MRKHPTNSSLDSKRGQTKGDKKIVCKGCNAEIKNINDIYVIKRTMKMTLAVNAAK